MALDATSLSGALKAQSTVVNDNVKEISDLTDRAAAQMDTLSNSKAGAEPLSNVNGMSIVAIARRRQTVDGTHKKVAIAQLSSKVETMGDLPQKPTGKDQKSYQQVILTTANTDGSYDTFKRVYEEAYQPFELEQRSITASENMAQSNPLGAGSSRETLINQVAQTMKSKPQSLLQKMNIPDGASILDTIGA